MLPKLCLLLYMASLGGDGPEKRQAIPKFQGYSGNSIPMRSSDLSLIKLCANGIDHDKDKSLTRDNEFALVKAIPLKENYYTGIEKYSDKGKKLSETHESPIQGNEVTQTDRSLMVSESADIGRFPVTESDSTPTNSFPSIKVKESTQIDGIPTKINESRQTDSSVFPMNVDGDMANKFEETSIRKNYDERHVNYVPPVEGNDYERKKHPNINQDKENGNVVDASYRWNKDKMKKVLKVLSVKEVNGISTSNVFPNKDDDKVEHKQRIYSNTGYKANPKRKRWHSKRVKRDDNNGLLKNSKSLMDAVEESKKTALVHDREKSEMIYKHSRLNTLGEKAIMKEQDLITSEELKEMVGYMVWEVVKRYAISCHLVLAADNTEDGIFPYIVRLSNTEVHDRVIIDGQELLKRTMSFNYKSIWGTSTTTCHTLLLHLSREDNDPLFSILEESALWLLPATRVIIVGVKTAVKEAFAKHALRNTLDVVYFGLPNYIFSNINSDSPYLLSTMGHNAKESLANKAAKEKEEADGIIAVYSRCFYCQNKEGRSQLLFLWYIGSQINQTVRFFPDQLRNLHGHQFQVVSVTFFPYMDYTLDSDESASTVTPKDCMDFRMLKAFARSLNFTYEIRAPWDMQWGNPLGNGNWTGIIGTLQHNKADFSTVMAPNSGRLKVLNHARVYTADTLVVTSLKPRPLTQYLLVVRPFSVEVWLSLLLSIIIWGVMLWLILRILHRLVGGKTMKLSSSLFYGLGILLEDPPSKPPDNVTAQMLIGWWLVFCLVIVTGFRSSLVAHLTVQAKSKPIDSLQDLVRQNDWSWGIDQKMLLGAALNFFKSSTDPVVQEVYEKLEIIGQEEGLKKVSKGRFSFLAWKNNVYTAVESYHTDEFGETNYYIGKRGSPMLTDFGWGFRKGAPFQQRFSQMMNRLIEAGIIALWDEQVMNARVKAIRRSVRNDTKAESTDYSNDTGSLPLEIGHLQGVFLILLLGYVLAILVFLAEKISSNTRLEQKYSRASKSWGGQQQNLRLIGVTRKPSL